MSRAKKEFKILLNKENNLEGLFPMEATNYSQWKATKNLSKLKDTFPIRKQHKL